MVEFTQYALKGQKLLAQGSALGIMAIGNAPCKGKSFMYLPESFKAFALTGRQPCVRNNPGRCPGLRASALSGRMGKNLRNFNYHIRCRIDSFPSLKRRSRILMLGRKPSLCS